MIWFVSLIDSRIAEHEAQSPEIWNCNRSTMEVLMLLRWIVHLQLERRIQCERFRFGLETLNDTTAPHLQWDLPGRVCHFRLCWFAERPLLTGLQTKIPGCLMCEIFGKKCCLIPVMQRKSLWPNEPGSFRVNVNNETTGEKTSRGFPVGMISQTAQGRWFGQELRCGLIASQLIKYNAYGSYCLSSGWALARSISATGGQIFTLVSLCWLRGTSLVSNLIWDTGPGTNWEIGNLWWDSDIIHSIQATKFL